MHHQQVQTPIKFLSGRLNVHILFCFIFHFAICSSSATNLIRYVTLRDGSILKVNIGSPTSLTWSAEKDPVSLKEVSELTLSKDAQGNKIKTIRSLVKKLSDPTFGDRKVITQKLLESCAGFKALLKELKLSITDPEARSRLAMVISKLSDDTVSVANYDLIVTKNGERYIGDLKNWSETVDYRGSKLKLTRKNVSKISVQLPTLVSSADSVMASNLRDFEEIREDKDANFSGAIVRIGFEKDGEGKPLRIGDDISTRFKRDGFRIESSIKGAIVSVNNFTVNGRSKGLSAATHAPLWEGTLIIKFHAQNTPSIPAFVKTAGLWVASVSPGGTALEAYNAKGELVGKVVTKSSGHEFLAFRSKTPISEIRVVPNPKIDRNYTIDDLFFSKPLPMDAIPENGWATVYTRSGERLLGRKLHSKDKAFVIEGLSYGAEQVQLNLADISSFVTKNWNVPQERPQNSQHWALLKTGTKLLVVDNADGTRKPVSLEASELKLGFDQVDAIWGLSSKFKAMPKDLIGHLEEKNRAVVNHSANDWGKLKDVSWGKTWIQSTDKLPIKATYKTSPMTWFSKHTEMNQNAGRITLKTGEIIILPPNDGQEKETSLLGFDSTNVYLRFGGRQATIPIKYVSFCKFPQQIKR